MLCASCTLLKPQAQQQFLSSSPHAVLLSVCFFAVLFFSPLALDSPRIPYARFRTTLVFPLNYPLHTNSHTAPQP